MVRNRWELTAGFRCAPTCLPRFCPSAFEVRFDDGSTGAYDLFSATFYIVEDDGPGSSGLQTSGSFARRNSTGSSAYVWYANEEGRRDAEQVLSASPSLPRQPQVGDRPERVARRLPGPRYLQPHPMQLPRPPCIARHKTE